MDAYEYHYWHHVTPIIYCYDGESAIFASDVSRNYCRFRGRNDCLGLSFYFFESSQAQVDVRCDHNQRLSIAAIIVAHSIKIVGLPRK